MLLGPPYDVTVELGADLDDPEAFLFDRVSSQRWGNDDKEIFGTLNARVPLALNWFRGYVKVGLKQRNFERRQYSYTDVYSDYQDVFTLADVVAGYHNPGVIDGRYDHGPMPDLHASRRFLADNMPRFVYSLTESRLDSDPITWTVNQDINAAYGLVYMSRGGLRMVAGVRFEQTSLSYEAGEVLLDENGEFVGANRLTDDNRYRNLFPGIHFRYDRGRFSYTGSWSNTILRPWFGMVVPYRFVNQWDEFIGEGNPELRPSLLENYNAAVDYKVSDNTTLSLEFSYVEGEDMFFYKVTRVEEGPFAGYRLGTNLNGPSARLRGIRAIWNQSLGDVSPLLQAVSFNLDYTYNHSETEYPSRPGTTLPVQATPEHGLQFNVRYASERIFAQLHCSYRDEQLGRIGYETWRDRYDFDQFSVSFSGSYSVTKKIRIFLNIHNLLNEPAGRSYLGDQSRPSAYNWDPRRFNFGLRVEL